MADYTTIVTASLAAPGLVGVLTIPSLWQLGTSIRHRRSASDAPPQIYEDKDGRASEESTAAFSTKRYYAPIAAMLAAGLGCAFALAVYSSVEWSSSYSDLYLAQIWALFGSWVSGEMGVLS